MTKFSEKEIWLEADQGNLETVFHNLIMNALRYSKVNKRKWVITLSAKKQKGFYLIIVEDNGPGIAQALRHRVFSKLTPSDSAREIQTDSSGIGLYLARLIVQSLGGDLFFKTKIDLGTQFIVKIPY